MAAVALALALPASLEKVAAALDLAQRKDDDGRRATTPPKTRRRPERDLLV